MTRLIVSCGCATGTLMGRERGVVQGWTMPLKAARTRPQHVAFHSPPSFDCVFSGGLQPVDSGDGSDGNPLTWGPKESLRRLNNVAHRLYQRWEDFPMNQGWLLDNPFPSPANMDKLPPKYVSPPWRWKTKLGLRAASALFLLVLAGIGGSLATTPRIDFAVTMAIAFTPAVSSHLCRIYLDSSRFPSDSG